MSGARLLRFLLCLLLLLLLRPEVLPAQPYCPSDVPGSYGDHRETLAPAFAGLVGMACGGNCYRRAAQWSTMALRHGDRRVDTVSDCRALCAATPGCVVFTHDRNAGTCRAMRALRTSPTLAVNKPNVTTGRPSCDLDAASSSSTSSSAVTAILPFPNSLTAYTPSDADDPCFQPGLLYGDGRGACAAPLLAVHAPQRLLDQGVANGWWDHLRRADPTSTLVLADVQLVATPNGIPYLTAQECSQVCGDLPACDGFSFTLGLCLLRGTAYQPAEYAGEGYSINTSCTAPFNDALAGPPRRGFASNVNGLGACVRARTGREHPEPAKTWFDQCDLPRCTKTEDVGPGGTWFDPWDLPAPFPQNMRDFVFQAKPPDREDGSSCYFPAYNRDEIRTLLGGVGSPAGTEAWVIVAGGSNSYNMGGTVFKAVHNTGLNDGVGGKGLSGATVGGLSKWQTHSLTDTIRYPDGTSKYRTTNQFKTNLESSSGFDAAVAANMLAWFKDVEFTPGAIRVTHMGNFYFKGIADLVNKVLADYLKTGPWKRLLMWSHSTQRSSTPQVVNDLTELGQSAVCARNGVLCVVGTKYPRFEGMIAEQKKLTFPHSPVRLLDTSHIAFHKGQPFEWPSSHGLQSLHLMMFQMLLNSWDLDVTLSAAAREKAVQAKGCPEAVRMPCSCHSKCNNNWNDPGSLCDFERDEITPLYGLSAFAKARVSLSPPMSEGGAGNTTNNTNSTTSNNATGAGNIGGGGNGQIASDDTVAAMCRSHSGTMNAGIDLYFAIEWSGNRALAAQKEFQLQIAEEERIWREATGLDAVAAPVSRPRLCKGRIWCGYEYHAWALSMSAACAVGVWWAVKLCLSDFRRDQAAEDARKKKKTAGNAQSAPKMKASAAAAAKTAQKNAKRRRRRSSVLDPGNGGRREQAGLGGNDRKGGGCCACLPCFGVESTAEGSTAQGKINAGNSKGKRTQRRRMTVFNSASTKPLSTATGERITSLGPARFMASRPLWRQAGTR